MIALRDRQPAPREGGIVTIDLPGAVLLSTALVTLNLALATGGEIGAGTGTGMRALGGTENPLAAHALTLLAGSCLCFVTLIAWELRTHRPLLPIPLYRQPTFLATIASNLCVGAILMAVMVNIPVVVSLTTTAMSTSVTTAGLLAPFTIAIACASLAASAIARRLGEPRTMIGGVVLTIAGCVVLAALIDRDQLRRAIPGLMLTGLGLGLLLPPLGTLPIHIATLQDRGAAASSALMFRLLGMTVGVSALTSLGVRRLQDLTSQLEPIVRDPDESTATFLVRQQQFVIDHAIPLSIQVVQETFVAAGVIAALAAIPIATLARYLGNEIEQGRL
jgi:hypothetical protein